MSCWTAPNLPQYDWEVSVNSPFCTQQQHANVACVTFAAVQQAATVLQRSPGWQEQVQSQGGGLSDS
jgi:hypothetical protein